MATGEVFEFPLDVVMKYGLSSNNSISEEIWDDMQKEVRIIELKRAALNFVSYKPRTQMQVSRKLRTKGYTNDEIDIALKFLAEFNYIDDTNFANSYVKDYLARKPVSKNKLLQSMMAKGIPRDEALSALDDKLDDDSELENAISAGRKKIKTIKATSRKEIHEKLYRYLAGQGYRFDIIRQATDELTKDLQSSAD
jgi:regulatory protein